MTKTYETIYESEAEMIIEDWKDIDLQNMSFSKNDKKHMAFCMAYLYMLKNDIAGFSDVIDSLEEIAVELSDFKDRSNVTMFDMCNVYNKPQFLQVLFDYESKQICKLIEGRQEFAKSKSRSRM